MNRARDDIGCGKGHMEADRQQIVNWSRRSEKRIRTPPKTTREYPKKAKMNTDRVRHKASKAQYAKKVHERQKGNRIVQQKATYRQFPWGRQGETEEQIDSNVCQSEDKQTQRRK